jgi:hypothetical protein
MKNSCKKSTPTLSAEGRELLSHPILRSRLERIAETVGVTAEEYLIRFEEILNREPQKIISAFERGFEKGNRLELKSDGPC